MLCMKPLKIYVGQSVDIRERLKRYATGKCGHALIGKAIRKYGVDSVQVLVFYIGGGMGDLDRMEECLIDDLNTTSRRFGYNIIPNAAGHAGVRIPAGVREKMSENHADVSGERNPFYGKRHGLDALGRMRCKRSAHGAEAISKSNKRRKGRCVEAVDSVSGVVVATYDSERDAAKAAGISQASMNARLRVNGETLLGKHVYRIASPQTH